MNRRDFARFYRKLSSQAMGYAECVKITRVDAKVFRFTGHDYPLKIIEEDGLAYEYTPAGKLQLTSLESRIGLSVQNYEFSAFIEDDELREGDIDKGLYIEAEVRIFLAYWSDNSPYVSALPINLGWFGEITKGSNAYTAEVRGLTQKLAQIFIEETSIDCRYVFGDSKCGVDLTAGLQHTHTIDQVISRSKFTVSETLSTVNPFRFGLCTFSSGQNIGAASDITEVDGQTLTLFGPLPVPFKSGDTVTLTNGCAKNPTSCKLYSNFVRYGGEPYLTATEQVSN